MQSVNASKCLFGIAGCHLEQLLCETELLIGAAQAGEGQVLGTDHGAAPSHVTSR